MVETDLESTHEWNLQGMMMMMIPPAHPLTTFVGTLLCNAQGTWQPLEAGSRN